MKQAKDLPNPVFVCGKSDNDDESAEALPDVETEESSSLRSSVELIATIHENTDENLCDNVKQISGYVRLGRSKKNYFFWFFESRSDPSKDPLVLWLTGGPGCSSEIALFGENGPCTIDGTSTKSNKYSWNSKANLLYVDQPSGTGFSYGGEEWDHNERDVSNDMYLFLTTFLQRYDKYRNLPFYIFGESYAGVCFIFFYNEISSMTNFFFKQQKQHYVPASAHRMWVGNNRKESPITINLKGVSVGNGI